MTSNGIEPSELENQAKNLQPAADRNGRLFFREKGFQLLSQINALLLSSESPESVVQAIGEKVLNHLGCDLFLNYMMEETSGRLRLNAFSGVTVERAEAIRWLQKIGGASGCAVCDCLLIISPDAGAGLNLPALLGMRAYSCHPLTVGGERLGNLSFGSSSRAGFTPDEDDLIKVVAGQISIAMERKRAEEALRESERMQLELAVSNERERTRLAAVEKELLNAKSGLESIVAERTAELTETISLLKEEVDKRTAAEEMHSKSEALLKTILETLPVGVGIVNPLGKLSYLNPALIALWEGSKNDLTQLWDSLLLQNQKTDHSNVLAVALRGDDQLKTAIFEIETFAGKKRAVMGSCSPIRIRDKAKVGAVFVIQDITEQQELQKQLLHAQKLESLGSLAGGIAHDFNNLLTVICGYAGELFDELSDELSRQFLQRVLDAGDLARQLTQKLLAFSRQQVAETSPMSLTDAVKHVLDLVLRLIGENIMIRYHLIPDPLIIEGSSSQIEQVLMNILLNARDAIADTGKITVRTARVLPSEAGLSGLTGAGEFALIEITDTGVGIPPTILDRIFDPYFTTKEAGKGTGLGLAIAYGIVRQHQGAIKVSSIVGSWTTFRLFFPLSTRLVDVRSCSAAPELPGGNETVLIVEDDPLVRACMESTLLRKGYRILTAADGAEAMEAAASSHVDILVTDVIMPVMNGMELFSSLKKIQPDMKVLFVSGYPSDILSAKGMAGHRFLQKPLKRENLLAEIRDILDSAERP